LKAVAFFVSCSILFIFQALYLAFCRRRRLLNTRGSYPPPSSSPHAKVGLVHLQEGFVKCTSCVKYACGV